MLAVVPALATPLVGLTTWILAYQIAISHLPTPPCCENGMNMAPVFALLFGCLGLGLAGVIGGAAGMGNVDRALQVTLAAIAALITLITAAFIFFEPPRELTAEKTDLHDYWPLTPDSIGALVLGFTLTVTPWTMAAILLAISPTPPAHGERDPGGPPGIHAGSTTPTP